MKHFSKISKIIIAAIYVVAMLSYNPDKLANTQKERAICRILGVWLPIVFVCIPLLFVYEFGNIYGIRIKDIFK